MNWYISKVVFTISVQNTPHKAQFEEQLRLIKAGSHDEAFLKARTIGLAEEYSFINERNNLVRWDFVNVADIRSLQKLEDGVELTSRLYEMEEGHEHIHYLNQKALTLRSNPSPLL